jgi:hypothetical protein
MTTNRLILFLHGWNSNSQDAWARFPELLRRDADIAARYAYVETFDYNTAFLGATPALTEVAQNLKLFLDDKIAKLGLDEITLIAHSQGGLLARRYLCNCLGADASNKNAARPLFRLITFATPHWGAHVEILGIGIPINLLPDSRAQQKDLAYDSAAIQQLNQDWARTDAEEKVQVLRVVASQDKNVHTFSAQGANFALAHVRVPGYDHSSIVKVTRTEHPAFGIAQRFLLTPAQHHPALVNPDYTPPVLENDWQTPQKIEGNRRFIYTNRYIECLGREAEHISLENFSHTEKTNNIAWLWIKGPGGMGKSRLALEFCLAMQADWHTGFLDMDANAPDWTRWQPKLPTLLVIDYATTHPDKLGKILRGLCNRSPERHLRRPVRLLLLDRDQRKEELQKAIGTGKDAQGIEDARLHDLELSAPADPWPVIAAFLTQAQPNTPLPDKASTLESLKRIDPAQRPLFAMLLADAITQGLAPDHLDRKSLLSYVLKRERDKYWQPGADKCNVPLKTAERYLALATVVNGLPREEVPKLQLDPWNGDIYAPLLHTLSSYNTRTETLAPLAPDLLGECHVLEHFEKAPNSELKQTLTQAFDHWPGETFTFFDRVAQDFADAELLSRALQIKPQTRLGRLVWAGWIVNLTNRTTNTQAERARLALQALTQLAARHSDQPEIRLELAKAAVNMINGLAPTEPEDAKALFKQLKQLAAHHSDQPEIRLALAQAAFNMIHDLAPTEPGYAKALFKQLKQLAARHSDQPEIRLELAKAAFNMISHLAPTEPGYAKALFKQLEQLAAHHSDQPEIQLALAKAAFNMIHDLAPTEPGYAKALFEQLKQLAARDSDQPEIRLRLAKAAFNMIHDLAPTEPGYAKALFEQLKQLAARDSDQPEIRLRLAKAAFNMILRLGPSDPDYAIQTFKGLQTLVQTHPDEAELSDLWAKFIALITQAKP